MEKIRIQEIIREDRASEEGGDRINILYAHPGQKFPSPNVFSGIPSSIRHAFPAPGEAVHSRRCVRAASSASLRFQDIKRASWNRVPLFRHV